MEDLERADAPLEASPGLGAPGRIVFAGFALAAAYFLWTEHRAHLIEFLPWGILALCPLMHVFMHRGHGGHGGGGGGGAS